jgi:hypothetical protein
MPLAQGVDTKTDEKQVVAGKLLELENGVFTKLKAIQKRNGYRALGTSITNAPAVTGPQPVPSTGAELWYPLNDGPLVAEARNIGTLSPYPSSAATLTATDNTKVDWNAAMPGVPWASPCLRVLERDVEISGASTVDPLNNSLAAISFWFYGETNNFASEYTFLTHRIEDVTSSYQFTIGWNDNLSDNLHVGMKTYTGPLSFSVATGNYTRANLAGKVSFIVANYTGIEMQLWVDGALVGNSAKTNGLLPSSTPLMIGRNDNSGGTARTALGYYADFRVSSTPLTQAEINQMWLTGSGA